MRECLDRLRVLVVLAKNMPLGRIALSSLTGISERKTRRILEELRLEGIISVDRVAGSEISDELVLRVIGKVFYEYVKHDVFSCITGVEVDSDVYNITSNRYLFVRDVIVLGVGWPGVLDLIGLYRDGELLLPGVPREVEEGLRGIIEVVRFLLSERCRGFCVFSITRFRKCCSLLAAALLYAVASACGVVKAYNGVDFCG